jgi:eukaryotic-like serine/threonine-protein kinase
MQPPLSKGSPREFSFAGHTLDLTRGTLRRGMEEVKLRPKSFEALKYLVENAGRLVPKSELIAALWPDATAVDEDSLTHCVMDVRKALADTGQQIVRTVPGRGYLFNVLIRHSGNIAEAIPARRSSRAWRIPKKIATSVAFSLAVVAALGLFFKQRADQKWANDSASRVVQLAAVGRYPEAYELASQVLARDPSQLRVSSLISELSDDLSISTKPVGAEVYLRRLGSRRAERVGVTPINHLRIARAEYILSIRKAGYADFERTVSSALQRTLGIVSKKSLENRTQQELRDLKDAAVPPPVLEPWEIRIQQELRKTSKLPRDMVAIPGGEYRLRNTSRPTETSVELADYFIDKFEVSNRDFKAFVDAGGYRNHQFWEGAPYDAQLGAPKEFTDKTGLPGPRGWIGGTFPTGKEMYPVTGITWHEARAFCRFRGKELPTLFEWEKAAKPPEWTPFGVTFPWGLFDPSDVTKRANINSTGLAHVNSFEFGMSHFGVYNTAGNAAEWIRNRYGDGYAVAGGASNEPPYAFLFYRAYPALYSSETLGCRCVLSVGSTPHDEPGMPLSPTREVLHYPVSSDREFKASAAHYAYKHTPLNAAILGVEESASWRREEISFDGRGGQRMKAFLYLPKSAAPYQVIHYLGGAGLWFGVPVTEDIEGAGGRLSPYLRAGRAVFVEVLEGFNGRDTGKYAKIAAEVGSPEYREGLISWVGDMQRGVDYLETRSDIDTRKIAFWNDSTYEFGVLIAAINQRYSSVILVGSGGGFAMLSRVPADINPFHFAPHIRAPKLVLNGRYDDMCPETSVGPFFGLLQAPKKRLQYEGAHIPPPEIAVPIINGFLDETLGPVRR